MTDAAAIDGLAERLFRAFEANDAATIGDCCDPAAVFSKNGVSSGPLAELLPKLGRLRERFGDHRYVDVRRSIFDGGFVEEHRVMSTLPSGEPLDVVACVVGRVNGAGRVIELAEYVGPAGNPKEPR
ncbi:MAG: nuclear transport factor 2 family protein [Desertimonas sp.]